MKYKYLLALLLTCGALAGFGNGLDLENGEFVYGFYSADEQTDANFELIRGAGITHVHTYATGKSAANAANTAFLDRAQKHGLKVLFDLNGRTWFDGRFDQEKFLALIDSVKDHPALDLWYLYDEPGKREQLEPLRQAHRLLQQRTPAIPTSLVTSWVADWWRFAEACDVQMLDIYPVRHEPFPQAPINKLTDFVGGGFNRPDRKIFAVLQSCSWECFRHQIKVPEGEKCRFPNAEEMRYMGFGSVALGVRGIFFYSFYHIHTTPSKTEFHQSPADLDQTWYQAVFQPFMAEIKAFTTEVEKTWDVTAIDRKYNKENRIQLAFWQRDHRAYLTLANGTGTPREFALSLPAGFPRDGELIPWGKTAKEAVSLRDGVLSVKAEPWQVFLWRVEPGK